MSTTATTYLKKAASQIGYYSPRPRGKSKYGVWYGDQVKDSSFDSAPWCAMFVSWVADQTGATGIPLHAYTPSGVSWFKSKKRWYTKPKVGDIVYYRFSGTRVHHVGIVEKVHSDGSITAIEGNTSGVSGGDTRNGGLVARKRRKSGIVGYGRPTFSGGTTTKRDWLQQGDTGAEVKYVQERLAVHGFPTGIDGDYGPDTIKKVKEFQTAKGLKPVDGLVGKVTLAELSKGVNTTKPVGRTWLQVGDTGPEVEHVQTRLGIHGFSTSVDGKYGSDTFSKVKAFQSAKGLKPVDGLAGKDTLAALNVDPTKPEPKPDSVAFWLGLANVGGYEPNTNSSKNKKVGALLKSLKCSMYAINEAIYSSQTTAYKKALGSNFGHDGSSYGNDVYFDKNKFKKLSSASFQITGIAQKNRSVERIRFERDGQKFTLFVTHMPHDSTSQRQTAADFVVKKIKEEPKGTAIILAGDFNNESGYQKPHRSPRYIFEKAGLVASRTQAKTRVKDKVNEMHDRKPEGRGYWVSDVYTLNCEVTDIRLVETADNLLDHDWFTARVVIGA